MIKSKKQIIALFSFLLLCTSIFSQAEEGEFEDTIQFESYENFINIIESTLEAYYKDFAATQFQTDSIIASFGHDYDEVPEFEDSVYCERLSQLDAMTPLQMECNSDVLKTIKFFAKSRRNFTSVVLGRSKLYFGMFEEKLINHDLPIELKYLAVIESGLRPQVKSRAGALGLWQFMYRTGKIFGLNENSYIDDRMSPELATEAACLYLKQLHGLYDDWFMALAAYNAGPGNVNKAIRRSGGKMTYWEIRPYLPRETQGYVPNFIAVAYLLTYHAEHNIIEREPKIYDFQTDTVCLRNSLHMVVIDSLINWSVEDIKALNPVYKTNFIPKTNPSQCIQIPNSYIKDWIAMEDSIYVLDSLIYNTIREERKIEEPLALTHHVRKGQTLGYIAKQYGTTVHNIMNWNNLSSSNLSIGQKLLIYSKNNQNTTKNESSGKESKELVQHTTTPSSKNTSSSVDVGTYTISSGDSLWAIAKENDTTVEMLKRLNPNVNYKDLKVGQQIRIR